MTQRQEIIERLNGLELEGGSHEMLSAICKAVLPHGDAWTLRRCWDLRDRLVRLLGGDAMQDRSITDELRDWARGLNTYNRNELQALAIADRIDAAHEEALREAYTKGREDGMGMANAKDAQAEYLRGKNDGYDEGWDAGFASADDWCAQHEDAMNEHGWVKLPKDADGEYIHIGDKVTCGASVWEVTGFRFTGGFGGICCTIFNDQGGSGTNVYPPSDLHHYHEPTVEDLLREMLDAWGEMPSNMTNEVIVAEYAAKLRLAGDAE